MAVHVAFGPGGATTCEWLVRQACSRRDARGDGTHVVYVQHAACDRGSSPATVSARLGLARDDDEHCEAAQLFDAVGRLITEREHAPGSVVVAMSEAHLFGAPMPGLVAQMARLGFAVYVTSACCDDRRMALATAAPLLVHADDARKLGERCDRCGGDAHYPYTHKDGGRRGVLCRACHEACVDPKSGVAW